MKVRGWYGWIVNCERKEAYSPKFKSRVNLDKSRTCGDDCNCEIDLEDVLDDLSGDWDMCRPIVGLGRVPKSMGLVVNCIPGQWKFVLRGWVEHGVSLEFQHWMDCEIGSWCGKILQCGVTFEFQGWMDAEFWSWHGRILCYRATFEFWGWKDDEVWSWHEKILWCGVTFEFQGWMDYEVWSWHRRNFWSWATLESQHWLYYCSMHEVPCTGCKPHQSEWNYCKEVVEKI